MGTRYCSFFSSAGGGAVVVDFDQLVVLGQLWSAGQHVPHHAWQALNMKEQHGDIASAGPRIFDGTSETQARERRRGKSVTWQDVPTN